VRRGWLVDVGAVDEVKQQRARLARCLRYRLQPMAGLVWRGRFLALSPEGRAMSAKKSPKPAMYFSWCRANVVDERGRLVAVVERSCVPPFDRWHVHDMREREPVTTTAHGDAAMHRTVAAIVKDAGARLVMSAEVTR
jgi:hypothetical protein